MEILLHPPGLVECTCSLWVIPGASGKVLDTILPSVGPSVDTKKMLVSPLADVRIMLGAVEDRAAEPGFITS